MSYWDILSIEPTGDKKQIKRAYSKLLKKTRPEEDAKAYQSLRNAYEEALSAAEEYLDNFEEGREYLTDNVVSINFKQQAKTDSEEPNGIETSSYDLDKNDEKDEKDKKDEKDEKSEAIDIVLVEKEIDNNLVEDAIFDDTEEFIETGINSDIFYRMLNEIVSSTEQIKAFEKALMSDDFIDISNQHTLQQFFFVTILNWDIAYDTVFPGELFNAIKDYYEWDLSNELFDPEEVEFIQHRLSAFYYYKQIASVAQKKKLFCSAEEQAHRSACKALLSPVPGKLSRHHFFILSPAQNVYGIIDELQQNFEPEHYPEFNTSTLQWWIAHREKRLLSMADVLVILFAVVFSMAYILEHIMVENVLTFVLLVATVLFIVQAYVYLQIMKLVSKLHRWYVTTWTENYQQKPKIYYTVLAIVLILLLVSAQMPSEFSHNVTYGIALLLLLFAINRDIIYVICGMIVYLKVNSEHTPFVLSHGINFPTYVGLISLFFIRFLKTDEFFVRWVALVLLAFVLSLVLYTTIKP